MGRICATLAISDLKRKKKPYDNPIYTNSNRELVFDKSYFLTVNSSIALVLSFGKNLPVTVKPLSVNFRLRKPCCISCSITTYGSGLPMTTYGYLNYALPWQEL
jgi:hypothetical protein